jgi:hypothetical protein
VRIPAWIPAVDDELPRAVALPLPHGEVLPHPLNRGTRRAESGGRRFTDGEPEVSRRGDPREHRLPHERGLPRVRAEVFLDASRADHELRIAEYHAVGSDCVGERVGYPHAVRQIGERAVRTAQARPFLGDRGGRGGGRFIGRDVTVAVSRGRLARRGRHGPVHLRVRADTPRTIPLPLPERDVAAELRSRRGDGSHRDTEGVRRAKISGHSAAQRLPVQSRGWWVAPRPRAEQRTRCRESGCERRAGSQVQDVLGQ